MKHACQYAIVHFLPYIETGEFANIGVVLFCQEKHFFDFRLLQKGRSRITHFFDKLDPEVFIQGKKLFEKELIRIRTMLNATSTQDTAAPIIFAELVRQREALFRFDAARFTLTENPSTTLDEIFHRYVEHGFATKQYQEDLLRRQVHQLLKTEKLEKNFRQAIVGTDDFRVSFPFVHRNHAQAIIKPLYLGQNEPTAVYEHGDMWIKRLVRLKKKLALPKQVLFMIEEPGQAAEKRVIDACKEVEDELRHLDVNVVTTTDTQAVLDFARQCH